jgi:hypothetical protein
VAGPGTQGSANDGGHVRERGVDLADRVVLAIGDVEVVGSVEGEPGDGAEPGVERRDAVDVALVPNAAGNGVDDVGRTVDASNVVLAGRDVEVVVRVERHVFDAVEAGVVRVTAVTDGGVTPAVRVLGAGVRRDHVRCCVNAPDVAVHGLDPGVPVVLVEVEVAV